MNTVGRHKRAGSMRVTLTPVAFLGFFAIAPVKGLRSLEACRLNTSSSGRKSVRAFKRPPAGAGSIENRTQRSTAFGSSSLLVRRNTQNELPVLRNREHVSLAATNRRRLACLVPFLFNHAVWLVGATLVLCCSGRPAPEFEGSLDSDLALESERETANAKDGGPAEPTIQTVPNSEAWPPGQDATVPSNDSTSEASRLQRLAILNDVVEGPPGPPCDAVKKVFQVSCGSECHVGIGIGDFALGEKQAAAYVGKAPNLNSPSCGLMIDPDNPLNSLILTKVTGDFPFEEGECRTLMPPPYGGVTDAQVECLESWLWQFRREN